MESLRNALNYVREIQTPDIPLVRSVISVLDVQNNIIWIAPEEEISNEYGYDEEVNILIISIDRLEIRVGVFEEFIDNYRDPNYVYKLIEFVQAFLFIEETSLSLDDSNIANYLKKLLKRNLGVEITPKEIRENMSINFERVTL